MYGQSNPIYSQMDTPERVGVDEVWVVFCGCQLFLCFTFAVLYSILWYDNRGMMELDSVNQYMLTMDNILVGNDLQW